MLEKIKTFLFGKEYAGATFIRSLTVQTNKGPLYLWQKQPITFRSRWKRKKKAGEPFWELQNTISNPLSGRDDSPTAAVALSNILKANGVRFFVSYNREEGTFSIEFVD